MRLIIAEKPSVGRDIASALGSHRKGKGALTGNGWTVTWALGHLAELAPPDAYGEQYKKWRLETLPILPERFKVRVTAKTRDQFTVVKKHLRVSLGLAMACLYGRVVISSAAWVWCLLGHRRPVENRDEKSALFHTRS